MSASATQGGHNKSINIRLLRHDKIQANIRAPIANPSNSAQLGGTAYHSQTYIRV